MSVRHPVDRAVMALMADGEPRKLSHIAVAVQDVGCYKTVENAILKRLGPRGARLLDRVKFGVYQAVEQEVPPDGR